MPPRLVRFLRFNTVGLLGVVVQLAAVAVLVELLHLHYAVATALAIEISVLHNFAWHERWTWAPDPTSGASAARRDRGGAERRERSGAGLQPCSRSGVLLRCLLFHAGNGCVSVVGSLALLPVLVGHFHVHYLAANLLTIGATGLLNFLLGDHVVFATRTGGRAASL